MRNMMLNAQAVTEHSWRSDYCMSYLHGGSGPPLLMLHGLTAYSFSWRYNIPALVGVAEIFAPDFLGAGNSDRPPRGFDNSMRAIAERMLRFMDAMKIDHADVISTSHGGAVSVMMAAMAPDRFRRLILVAPVNPWSSHGRLITRLFATEAGASVFRLITPMPMRVQEFFLRRLYGDVSRIRAGTIEGYAKGLEPPGTIDYLLGVVASWKSDMHLLRDAYEKIAEIPTLLIWGKKDRAVLPSSAAEIQKRVRHCRVVMMDGVGHLPYEESPEEFNQIVIEELNERLPERLASSTSQPPI